MVINTIFSTRNEKTDRYTYETCKTYFPPVQRFGLILGTAYAYVLCIRLYYPYSVALYDRIAGTPLIITRRSPWQRPPSERAAIQQDGGHVLPTLDPENRAEFVSCSRQQISSPRYCISLLLS